MSVVYFVAQSISKFIDSWLPEGHLLLIWLIKSHNRNTSFEYFSYLCTPEIDVFFSGLQRQGPVERNRKGLI
jgi:hypothetical protein